MSSATDHGDLTARATIRNAALRLFGERGPDAVTVREIATQAGVSPALVLHHFGSKDGLRAEVDAFAAQAFDAIFEAMPTDDLVELLAGGAAQGSLAEAFARGFPPGLAAAGLPGPAAPDERPGGSRAVRTVVRRDPAPPRRDGRDGRRPAERGPRRPGGVLPGQRPRTHPPEKPDRHGDRCRPADPRGDRPVGPGGQHRLCRGRVQRPARRSNTQ